MSTSTSLDNDQLALAPMGAGDLIDRTIRLYRRHFLTLIRTAAPPVVCAAIGAVLSTVCVRAVPLAGSGGRLVLYSLGTVVGVLLSFSGPFFLLIVLGGASRNLVAHLLWREPVSARTIYKNVRARFWGLFGAATVIAICASVIWLITMLIWVLVVAFTVGIIFTMAQRTGERNAVLSIAFVVVVLLGMFAVMVFFFWLLGHLAYVPQVMMIEGRGVFEAVGRSISLARGNVRRLMGMFLFTTFATYSALMLLLIPLGWYGYLHGVNPFDLTQAEGPIWYAIGQQVVMQVSSILVMPVWMLGLSLLYVDERVRHEGYDIELLAAARLGDMPSLPDGRVAPLAPALVAHAQGAKT